MNVRVRAHAKINLGLRVLGRRDDGYHDLRTVFQVLSLHDTLTFVERPGPFALESDATDLPLDDRNLVWRAADALWRHLGRPGRAANVVARLEKRIPMKAGLGGGSADAAATLVGLVRVWGASLGADELPALGRTLGADVGFFFTGGAALGLGRGDEIHPLADLPRLGVLLVMPSFEVSTADAYRWIDEGRVGPFDSRGTWALAQGREVGPFDSHGTGALAQGRQVGQVGGDCCGTGVSPVIGQVGKLGDAFGPPDAQALGSSDPRTLGPSDLRTLLPSPLNDFEAVVAARYPELRAVIDALSAAGAAVAAMSGSGSSVFGLFPDLRTRDRAARTLARAGYRVARARTLSRAEYRKSSTPTRSAPNSSTGLSQSDAVV